MSIIFLDISARRPIPLWFCSALSDFARVHLRHFPDATPGRIRFRTPNTPRFLRSLFTDFTIPSVFILLPSSHLPASFCNPSDPARYPSTRIRNERTREKTNFESGCLKGRKSPGRRRGKRAEKYSWIFRRIFQHPPVSNDFLSVHLFIIDGRDFLKEILANSRTCYEKK